MVGRTATVVAFVLLVLACSEPLRAAPSYPALTGRIVDTAEVLSADTRRHLSALLEAHERATSNQVVVAIVQSLQGYEIEEYANGLFRAWRLGQQDRNNGVILLVALDERRVRIEVGYGLEGSLTDALSSDIIRNRILSKFRSGDFDAGVRGGVDGILAAIQGTYRPAAQPEPGRQVPSFLLILVILAIFFFGGGIYNAIYGRRYGRGYGPSIYIGSGGLSSRRAGFGGGSFGGGFSGGGGSSGGGGASGGW
jgi:uncharacterized protein